MDISYYKRYEPIFGSWHIVREIGEGSFGKVFEIEREDFGYTYKAALKAITIPQNQSEIDSIMSAGMDRGSATDCFRGLVEELVGEFRLMSLLKGESNIVSYEDHMVIPHVDGIGWDILIRMELLTPLLKYANENPLSCEDAVRLGMDMCKALELCRDNKIIHRDIKPENIFVSKNGKFKLGDFGIAKTAEKTMGGLSKKGTYTYMAPEVYKGEAYGPSVDIYSLGVVLYRYLNNGRTPFLPDYPAQIGYKDVESALMRRMKGETIPAPVNAGKELANVILKACAYDPNARYSHPTEMRLALEAAVRKPAPVPDGSSIDEYDKTVGVFTTKISVAKQPKAASEKAGTIAVEELETIDAETSDDDYDKTESIFTPIVKQDTSVTPIETPDTENSPANKQIDYSPNDKRIVTISAGEYHTVGLRADGTVAFAGYNHYAKHIISDWSNVVSVFAGRNTSTLGILSDGSLVVYAVNQNYDIDIIKERRDISSICIGGNHIVGLSTDGKVISTGSIEFDGRCDVFGWKDIAAICAGRNHTVGLQSDGMVVAVGGNLKGQCNVRTWRNIIAISAGEYHTVGLRSDGTVVATGGNVEGQCYVYRSDWNNIIAISAGAYHTIGLRSDGTVVATGRNTNGQCNVKEWQDIVAVSAGKCHTVGLRSDGKVLAVGDNSFKQCNVVDWFTTSKMINNNVG